MTSTDNTSVRSLHQGLRDGYSRDATYFWLLRWKFLTKVTYMYALMRGLAMMRPFMQAALDT